MFFLQQGCQDAANYLAIMTIHADKYGSAKEFAQAYADAVYFYYSHVYPNDLNTGSKYWGEAYALAFVLYDEDK